MAASSQSELQLLISVQDEATAALDEVQGSVDALGEAADAASSTATEALDQITSSSEETAAAVSGAMDQVGTAVDGAAGSADATTGSMQALEGAIRELTSNLQGLQAATTEAATGLDDVGAASEAAAEKEDTFAASMEEASAGLDATRAAMTGFMAIAAGGILDEVASGAEKTAISLSQLQGMTGQSATATEQLSLVASGAGVNLDSLTNMVGRMDMRMGRAMSGSASLSKTLSELGVNAQAFANADPSGQAQMLYEAMTKADLPAKQMTSILNTLGVNAQQFNAAAQPEKLTLLANGLQQVVNSGQSVGRMLQDAGINASAFMRLPFDQQLNLVAQAFNNTTNKAQATALVMTVFGRSGAQMIPLLQNFSQLDSYAKQLKMPVLDTNEITLAAEKTKMLMTAMEMLMDSVLVKVLPLVDNLAKAFYDLATNVTHPVQAIKDFVADLGPVPAAITAVVMAYEGMKVVNAVTQTVTNFKNGLQRLIPEQLLSKTQTIESTAADAENTVATEAKTVATAENTVATEAETVASTEATGATTALGAAMDLATGPIGLVALAVAGAVAVAALLITHWQQVKTVAEDVWNAVKGAVEGAANWIGTEGGGLLTGLVDDVEKAWTAFKDFTEKIWQDIENAVMTPVKAIQGAINTVTGAVSSVAKFLGLGGGAAGAVGSVSQAPPPIPHLAAGGVVHSPTLALIGEAGTEAVLPIGAGGYPINPGAVGALGGAGAAGAPVINVYVSGNVAANEQALATLVGSAVYRQLKLTGQFAT